MKLSLDSPGTTYVFPPSVTPFRPWRLVWICEVAVPPPEAFPLIARWRFPVARKFSAGITHGFVPSKANGVVVDTVSPAATVAPTSAPPARTRAPRSTPRERRVRRRKIRISPPTHCLPHPSPGVFHRRLLTDESVVRDTQAKASLRHRSRLS